MPMSIITISRGSYSKGKEIAEKVAEELGFECIAREIILVEHIDGIGGDLGDLLSHFPRIFFQEMLGKRTDIVLPLP